jgi:hypothetical protein
LVTIEYCRVSVTDKDLAAFLAPKLARKGIRNLDLRFDPGLVRVGADYPLNRFGFGDIHARATVALTAFDAAAQVVEFCISDFDLKDAGDRGFLGKMLGHAVTVAKKVSGGEIVKLGLEFLRGRVSFLDVDAPGLKMRVKVKTLAAIVSNYVHNMAPDEVLLEAGKFTLVQHGGDGAKPPAATSGSGAAA